jgi:4-hydroxy-4-methyl-2-oxoglutarate aldolase
MLEKPRHRLLLGVLLAIGITPMICFAQAQGDVKGPVKTYIPYEQYSQQDNERIVKLYEGLRVSDVADGMDMIGLADVGLVSTEIKTLWRDTDNYTHRICGIAVTARYVPTNKREPKMTDEAISRWYRNLTSEAFVDVLHPGSVLVIDGGEDNDSRSIGSSNIQKWVKKGAVGVVTSGGVGDTDEIIHQKIPVYYKRLGRGLRPGRNELESVNRPIMVGGVLVRPGDVVVGDGDGVIVVPRERAEAVAKAAMPFLDNIGLDRYKKQHQK